MQEKIKETIAELETLYEWRGDDADMNNHAPYRLQETRDLINFWKDELLKY